MARLRNQRFFSLAELNAAIRLFVVELNARQVRGFGSVAGPIFSPAAISPPASTCRSGMRARHVIGNGRMAAPVGRTGVAGDPLPLVEDLDGVVGDTHIDELGDEAVGRGILVPVDFDVIVGRDAATLQRAKTYG